MYNILSLLIGMMIAFNGRLSSTMGTYSSLLLIHIIGYIFLVIIMLIKKIKIPFKMNLPLYLYSAGAMSVLTVLFNNISFPKIGVSLPVSLGLLGQISTSLVFDYYGLLGMPKIHFNKKKLIGFAVIIVGIGIMTFI